jgi:hypothetical protein
MSFCGAEVTSLTDSDLKATYGSLTQPGLLPQEGFPSDARDERGILKDEFVKQTVKSLISSGKVPATTEKASDDTIKAYMAKDALFIESLKKEYCFYDARYRYALQQLIGKLQAGYTDTDKQKEQSIQNYLQVTQVLNQRLNDLTQITNEIKSVRILATKEQSSNINALNSKFASRSAKLAQQNKILSSQEATTLLYKDMVKYTKEKANSSNNLLSLYSFLNVVALGLLFYLYRSFEE